MSSHLCYPPSAQGEGRLGSGYTEIIVVRHGETAWNAQGRIQGHLDVELNDVGRLQAVAVADLIFKGSSISAVYSSDLKRALETAQTIASSCGVAEVMQDPDLRERHLGDLQGFTSDEASKLKSNTCQGCTRTDQAIPGGGESFEQLYQRCTSSLQKIGMKHIADLKLLKEETHKFESHYLDNLVGSEKEYFERSPINFVDKFSCPIILFQGLEDKVVPPGQARKIYQALKEKELPVALVEYEGEQHGFRKAENIKFTMEQQMLFFARLVGHFKVADEITPIKIDNFD